ncbi:MAG: hypothetical protein PHQ40_21760 [Anaerolineaceae bacterium]|nr:hypothetical protein [Anaerolineaceae bacterium]
MNKNTLAIGFMGIVAFLVILLTQFYHPAQAVVSTDDPDYIAIQSTLQAFAQAKTEIHYSFDDSPLLQVLANDRRGGPVNSGYLKLVQFIQGKPELKVEDIGLLEAYQARLAFERRVEQLYNAALARGEVKPPVRPTYDPSDNPISEDIRGTVNDPSTRPLKPDLREVTAIRRMEKDAGFIAVLPLSRTVKADPSSFKLLSISIDGDLAHAQVDWDYGLEDDILVKKDGKWYLVGVHILKWHGG